MAAKNYELGTKQAAFEAACARAGVCPNAKPDALWVVGDDFNEAFRPEYKLALRDKTTHGVYRQYETPQGSRVIVNHTNDGRGHFHAGEPKGDSCRSCVNFGWDGIKNSERYGAIGGSHHFYYDD